MKRLVDRKRQLGALGIEAPLKVIYDDNENGVVCSVSTPHSRASAPKP